MHCSDARSDRFVFTPFCSMAQAFHADGLVKSDNPASLRPVIQELLRHDANLVQMPCPEATFNGLSANLVRRPQSLRSYEQDDKYLDHCHRLAAQVAAQMRDIVRAGYHIALVLGIEYSPSCAISLHYTNRGTVRRPGLFTDRLQDAMLEHGVTAPYVGINRRGLGATVARIRDAMTEPLGAT